MPTEKKTGGGPAPPAPTHWARDVVGKNVEFAVEGYFPRGVVSSIYAPRDAGKTTVAIHFLAELSRGRLFGQPHPRIRSLFNSQEDSLATVIKPRLEAHDADFGTPSTRHPWIAITAEPWTFPDDLELLEAKLTQARDGGAPFDLVTLDSVAQHLVRLNSIDPMTRAMTGLIAVAEKFDLAILMIGHLTKSKGSTVESAIYGASVLQNLSKGLFVYGQIPDDPEDADDGDDEEGDEGTGMVAAPESGNPRFALSCERTGWGPKPPTMIFEREVVDLPAYRASQPRLTYAGGGRGLHRVAGQGVLQDVGQGVGGRQGEDPEGGGLAHRNPGQQGGTGRSLRRGRPGAEETGEGGRRIRVGKHLGTGGKAGQTPGCHVEAPSRQQRPLLVDHGGSRGRGGAE